LQTEDSTPLKRGIRVIPVKNRGRDLYIANMDWILQPDYLAAELIAAHKNLDLGLLSLGFPYP
jgi:hypothetical protein